MAYAPQRNEGVKLFISTTPSGEPTLEVKGVKSIDRFGVTHTEIDVTTLADEYKRRMKGLKDAGVVGVSGERSDGDAGQQKMVEARNSRSAYAFKIEYDNAITTVKTTAEFSAFVMTFDDQPGTPDATIQFAATLGVDGALSDTIAS